MKDYPREKYKYFVGPNKVVAVSTYAGRKVRGIAKCSPEDTSDLEKGKQLAAARCALKVAEKRKRRADAKWDEAEKAYRAAEQHRRNMTDYWHDSRDALMFARDTVTELEQKM